MKQHALLLSAFVLFPLWAVAQRETFDLLSFVPPPGWERKTQKGVISFLKTNPEQTSYCLIAVFDSRVGTDDLQKEFSIEWNSLIEQDKHIAAPVAPTVEKGNNGWSAVTGNALSATSPPYLANLITMVGQGRVVSMLFYISDEKYMPEVKQFISEMKLVPVQNTTTINSQPTSAAPITTSTGTGNASIAGIWRSLCNDGSDSFGVTNASGTGYSAIYSSSGKLRVKQIILFADGTFCNYMMPGGYLNYAEQRTQDPNTWGIYRLNGNNGEVKLDGISTPYPFELQNGKMKFGKCEYEHLPWVEDLRLNATYSVETDASSYKANNMNAEPIIRFTSDGRFSDTGAVYYLNHVKSSSNDFSDNKYGDGRYEIKLYTLSLYFDDGRTYRYTYHNLDGNVYNPPQIGVALHWLNRK
jgi:hypothetical protein